MHVLSQQHVCELVSHQYLNWDLRTQRMKAWTEQGCQVVLRCPHPWFIFPYVHKPNNASGLVPPRLVFIWEWCVSFGSTRLCVFFFFFIRNTSFKNLFWLHHTACEQGLNLRPRQWECEVLTNGPWGNSLHFCFFLIELFFTTVSTL